MSLLGKPDHWAITDPERTMNLSIYVDHITSFDHVKNIHAPCNKKKKKKDIQAQAIKMAS